MVLGLQVFSIRGLLGLKTLEEFVKDGTNGGHVTLQCSGARVISETCFKNVSEF